MTFNMRKHGPPPRHYGTTGASVSHLAPVRKIGTYDSPRNRRTVVDEYGAGPPEVARDSDRGVLCYGRKRDFSPYLNRGLGESHSTQYAVRTQYAKVRSTRVREKSLWTLFG